MDRLGGLVVIAPARRARDPGLNPGPGENFFFYIIKHLIFAKIKKKLKCADCAAINTF